MGDEVPTAGIGVLVWCLGEVPAKAGEPDVVLSREQGVKFFRHLGWLMGLGFAKRSESFGAAARVIGHPARCGTERFVWCARGSCEGLAAIGADRFKFGHVALLSVWRGMDCSIDNGHCQHPCSQALLIFIRGLGYGLWLGLGWGGVLEGLVQGVVVGVDKRGVHMGQVYGIGLG